MPKLGGSEHQFWLTDQLAPIQRHDPVIEQIFSTHSIYAVMQKLEPKVFEPSARIFPHKQPNKEV